MKKPHLNALHAKGLGMTHSKVLNMHGRKSPVTLKGKTLLTKNKEMI